MGLLDAQARRCGDVHLAFEYLGKGSTGAKAGKHLLRVGAEELCLCSVRDEELEVKELDIATKSESLTLALRLVSSIDILRGSSQIFFFLNEFALISRASTLTPARKEQISRV